MLEAKKHGEENGHTVVESKERCCSSLALHEWEVGFEEKAIVVISNKTVLGCEGLGQTSALFSERSLWCHIRTNLIRTIVLYVGCVRHDEFMGSKSCGSFEAGCIKFLIEG